MPAILTQQILPDPGILSRWRYIPGDRGMEQKIWKQGRCEVEQFDLALPFGLSGEIYRNKCRRILARMAAGGHRYAVLPRWLEGEGRAVGILPCDDLPALRRLAAQAVLDCMGPRAELGAVRVFARMPSREVVRCVEQLAQSCRYVSVSGGAWAQSAARRLLREYGTAEQGSRSGVFRVAVVFDGGFDCQGEDAVIDLTRGELRCPRRIRPLLAVRGKPDWLPPGGHYRRSPLLGHLYVQGMLEAEALKVWCKRLETGR